MSYDYYSRRKNMDKIMDSQDKIVNELYSEVQKIITENKTKMVYQINNT